MKLYPAMRIQGKVIKGAIGDTHNAIGADNGNPNPPETARGFTPDGKLFLSRQQALSWLRKFNPFIYKKLPRAALNGLHSEHLAAAYGVPVRGVIVEKIRSAEKQSSVEVDLSEKTAIVYDRSGLYLYCAEKLAEKYKKVMYYIAEADSFPTSQKHTIGVGVCKKVKRIYDFWANIDSADIICFFDCYDGELQHWLRSKGYVVFGTGRGEQVEIDKISFLERLEEFKLPCPKTYRAEGLADLLDYLQRHEGETLFLKNLNRGDFESRKFTSLAQSKPFFDDLKKRLGTAADTLEVLVQHKINSICEAGVDTFCIDGQEPDICITGYEIKSTCYVAKICETIPPVLGIVNKRFSPVLKKLGCRGNYSTEIMITEEGVPYYIDATLRAPSPPGEIICEIYENWAEAIWQIANGEVPVLKPVAKYGAELVLSSPWHESHELHVKFPPEYRQNIKLRNSTCRDGEYYCVPNDAGSTFGAVVAIGDTLDAAIATVVKIAKTVEADELEADYSSFEKAQEQISRGRHVGIEF